MFARQWAELHRRESELAEKEFKKVVELEPDRYDANHNLGEFYSVDWCYWPANGTFSDYPNAGRVLFAWQSKITCHWPNATMPDAGYRSLSKTTDVASKSPFSLRFKPWCIRNEPVTVSDFCISLFSMVSTR